MSVANMTGSAERYAEPDEMFLAARDEWLKQSLSSKVPGGSYSWKAVMPDRTGRLQPVLVFCDSSAGGQIVHILRQDLLTPLLEADSLEPAELQFELDRSRSAPTRRHVPAIALIHAVIPSKVACLLTAPEVLALGCVDDWQQHIAKALGGDVFCVPHVPGGLRLARLLRDHLGSLKGGAFTSVYLRYQGLLAFGEEPGQVQALAIGLLGRAAQSVRSSASVTAPARAEGPALSKAHRVHIAQLRKQLADRAGRPLLLRADCQPNLDGAAERLKAGAASAPMASHFPIPPLLDLAQTDAGVALPPNMIVLDPDAGLCLSADGPGALDFNQAQLQEEQRIVALAIQQGQYEPLPWGVEPDIGAYPAADPRANMFTGEVALVTGAASGIGRACIASLLERGAAVVGLDISETILDASDAPGYLGQVCDLTHEQAVLEALELAVRTFGGIDMVVLNAGIFPPSCAIDVLSLEHWRKVLSINLDANVTLLREAFPLLQRSPRYGRVVINGSRNVPAPGPGAAAYSASKAALAQLGRVAALEWGKSGIRINMVNPHAVFDTGIWTEEVLASRAAKYGLTVQQYKTSNVLGVELTSRDVAEMIAEMCGPLFSKITGAQLPMDGGSDRVI